MYNLSMYNVHVHSIILHVYISVCGGGLPEWNIVLIVLGVICFIAGVVIAVILVVFLLTKSGGKCACVHVHVIHVVPVQK